MTALSQFKHTVKLPAGFGPIRPYIRFAYVDPSQVAGADADVEYREHSVGNPLIVVTLSEWRAEPGMHSREMQRPIVFDTVTGEIVTDTDEDADEIVSGLCTAMSGMRSLDEPAEVVA